MGTDSSIVRPPDRQPRELGTTRPRNPWRRPVVAALGLVADSSPMGIAATHGVEHLVRFANPAFLRLVGRESAAVIGRPLAVTLNESHLARAGALLDRVYATGRAGRSVDLGARVDGQAGAPVTSLAWPVQSDDHQPTGLILQLSEASDPMQAEDQTPDSGAEVRDANRRLLVAGLEAQRQADAQVEINADLRVMTEALRVSERRYWGRAAELQATIDAIEDGVAVVDDAGEVKVVNEALVRVLGRSVATVADLGRVVSGANVTMGAEPRLIQMPLDGRWMEIRTFGVGVDVEHPEVAQSSVVMIRDVTEERAANDAREAFVGVLSHELRTPVTTIVGMARLLGRTAIERDEHTRHDMIDDITFEAERLDRLIEDLLVLSRAEKGQLVVDAEPVLLQHVIREAIAAEAGRFPLVTFVADVASLPPVSADRTYVGQIIRNLLSNAAKYGPDGSSEVRVSAVREGDEIVVQVLDAGPGFPAEDRERLFDLFFRAHSGSRIRPGAGIGLYVSRALVTAMGGRIWATEREHGGSAFAFTLPVMAAPIEPAIEEATPAP